MTTYTAQNGNLTQEDIRWFEGVNKGFKVTGETLTATYEDGSCTYIVFKGRYTPYGMVRDCGDHYIKAQYSRYDRIDKDTMKVTIDVEDR